MIRNYKVIIYQTGDTIEVETFNENNFWVRKKVVLSNEELIKVIEEMVEVDEDGIDTGNWGP